MEQFIKDNPKCYYEDSGIDPDEVSLDLSKYIVSEAQPFDISKIPTDVTYLHLPDNFYEHMIGNNQCLPTGISDIDFGNKFNTELESGFLPHGLLNIRFGEAYNKPIGYGVIPNTVEDIEFGDWYADCPIRMDFYGDFSIPKEQIILPISVKEVTINKDCLYDEPKESIIYEKGTPEFYERFTVIETMTKNANSN